MGNITIHGVSYTLKYQRRIRGKASFFVFLGKEQICQNPVTEEQATSIALDHWLRTNKLPKRRSKTPQKQIQEIRNSKNEGGPSFDNLNRDLEQMDVFLQFTACDFDVGDLGIF